MLEPLANKVAGLCMYIFIHSRTINIKIKIHNNMQLKYIKQIKPQHKVKPLHN